MKKTHVRTIAMAVTLGFGMKGAYAVAENTVVAKVNNEKITVKHLEDQKKMVPMLRGANLEAVFAPLREQAVVGEIISQAADKANVQKNPEFKIKIEEIKKGLAREIFLMQEAKKLVSDKDVQARYDELKGKFKPEEEVEVSIIAVKSEKDALDIIEALKKKSASFEELAKTKSMLPNAQQGGQAGFQVKGALPPALAGAAFALKKDDFTKKPVKTEGGFFIVKAGDKRMTKAPTLEQAAPQITEMLVGENVKKVVEGLRGKAKVELFKMDGSPENA